MILYCRKPAIDPDAKKEYWGGAPLAGSFFTGKVSAFSMSAGVWASFLLSATFCEASESGLPSTRPEAVGLEGLDSDVIMKIC
jgi:hypothetical protein